MDVLERAPTPGRVVVPLVAAVLTVCLQLGTAATAGYGLFRDELYFIACGQHLAFGYVDQPPMIALLARASHALFGQSLVGLRLLPALAAGGTVALAALLARELGGSRRAELLAAAATATAPVHLANFGILTMNAFDVLAWAAAFLVLARTLAGKSPRGWLWFGLIAGLGLENKLSMLFLGAGVAVGLVATSAGRRELRRPGPWLGGALALALAAPNLVWQALHGWPMRELIAATARKNVASTPWSFLAGEVLLIGPVMVPIVVLGAVWLLVAKGARPYRLLGVAALVVLGILLADRYAKGYYLAPLFALLFAAGAAALARQTSRRATWVPVVCAGLTVVAGLAALPLAKPVLSPDDYVAYEAALGVSPSSGERLERVRLPQLFADRLGWPELAHDVASAYAALPPADRAVACVFVDNYGEAAAIELYGAAAGLPPVLSGHNNYWVWGPRGCTGQVMIVLAGDRRTLDRHFTTVEEVARRDCADCMPYERRRRLFVARGLKVPIAEVWPGLRVVI